MTTRNATVVDFDNSLVYQRRNTPDDRWDDWATAYGDKEEIAVRLRSLAKMYPQSEWRVIRKITTVIEIVEG